MEKYDPYLVVKVPFRNNKYEVDVLNKEKVAVDKDSPLLFEQFVTMRDNFYYAEHPFDYALLKNGEKELVVKTAEILFYLGKKDS